MSTLVLYLGIHTYRNQDATQVSKNRQGLEFTFGCMRILQTDMIAVWIASKWIVCKL